MRKIVLLLVGYFLLLSCTRDELSNLPNDNVPEGVPMSFNLNLEDGVMQTKSGLTPSQESAVRSIFVLVFNKDGVKVSQRYYNSNVTANLKNIATQSGSNMSVYVITNLSIQNTELTYPERFFDHIYTIGELNEATICNLAADLNVNLDLVSYGMITGQTFNPNVTTSITINLHYVATRVTLYVVTNLTNASDSYNVTDWTVLNYPAKSYIIPQSTDAVTVGNTNDFINSATSKTWNDTIISINGVNTPAKYAFMYTFENRRGGRTGGNTGANQLDKAAYAPANATAIQFKGYYKNAATSTVTGVTTTVHLGADNFGDYNVQRGCNYFYTATVKGIADILIDSRVVANNSSFQVNVFNPKLDCHPDWRPLQISSWGGTASIKVLESATATSAAPAGFWLQVSSINLNQFVNNGSGTYVRPTYNPSVDMLSEIDNIVFTNTSSISSKTNYLYASENLSATPRTAYIQVSETGTGPVVIEITQMGYQTMGTVGMRPYTTTGGVTMSGDYTVLVENTEESSLNLTPGAAAGTEGTTVMQWGYNLTTTEPTTTISQNYYGRNGLANTQKLVYGSTSGLSSVLLPAFGRISASGAGSASVTISEQYKNPIFNTNAARYCFEKNRDLDGDGLISNPNTQGVNEVNWYLPATDELYQLFVGQYALANPLYGTGQTYISSTELYGSNNTVMGIFYQVGVSGSIGKSGSCNVRCIRKLPNANYATTPTSPYVEAGTSIVNNTQFNSAVLRGSTVGYPTPIHTYDGTINRQISPRFKVSKTSCALYGATGATTMTWAQANGWTTDSDVNSTAPTVLASPATGCNAYSEPGYPAGTWRVPTQRELYILQTLRPELVMYTSGSGYIDFVVNQYWTATTYNGNSGMFMGLYSNYIGISSNTIARYVRCIHDL